ncbi:hypothetical protein A5722_14875 [Mycobacterium vulneris]|nr:hypothetical protein A5722_14875 [Mycolicibacterium vulneris]OCB66212.1 hypothetical protein A5729_12380 [Mycolicibacterium vulneris]
MCAKCYQRWRAAAIEDGTFDPFGVDPEHVRQHIEALLAAGLHQAAIARAAGVQPTRIQLILRGQSDHDRRRPLTRVHRKTADRIFAVQIPENQVAALGAIRRVQALVALGYPLFEIAHRIHVTDQELATVAVKRPPMIHADLAAAIAGLYDQLHMVPGPSADARKQARQFGWAAPFAWESTAALDDPNAVPEGVPPRPTHIVIPPDFADIVADHRALGHSDAQIAAAMHITIDALQKRYKKFGIELQPEAVAS